MQPCSNAGAKAQLREAWGDDRRAQIHDAIMATGAAYAATVWETTERTLDTYADAWLQTQQQVCSGALSDGTLSSQVVSRQERCLDQARESLGAVTDVLAHPDAQTLLRSHRLLDGLPSVTRCTNIEGLESLTEEPLPQEKEAVDAGRSLLVRASAALLAGRYGEAETATHAAAARVAGLRYEPIHAALSLARGGLFATKGEYRRAETHFTDALRRASQTQRWDQLYQAASHLLFVVGHKQQRFVEAMRYADLLHGLAEGDPKKEATVLDRMATVLRTQGRYQDAETAHRRALELRIRALGPEH